MPTKSSAMPESETRVFNINKDLVGHEWRQQGYSLVCRSCELSHAIYIGPNKELVGFSEDGKPKFEKR